MSDQEAKSIKSKLPKDFDTTAELWDRIADELVAGRDPCVEVVEELKKDAEEAGE